MTKSFISFDVSAFDWFLNDAGQQYEKSSPTVETWLDQVADRLRDGSVTIRELRLVDSCILETRVSSEILTALETSHTRP